MQSGYARWRSACDVAWQDDTMSTDGFGSSRRQMLAEVVLDTIFWSAKIGKAALARPVMDTIGSVAGHEGTVVWYRVTQPPPGQPKQSAGKSRSTHCARGSANKAS